ncbi:MAG TPA: Gfo/Idh/MocA family oxidoreductase [Candidatus Hydrogenedentes bacterium]|nr:Gfo/Idh/MocA family oxidoreductase [Candidatus Hydrogenedentota bacterium]HOS02311.1 Gfo/Idh/MocA family oxidoreductase [Candidatus Hydrogenedentota bacterium]
MKRNIIVVGVGGMGGVWTAAVAGSTRWKAAAYVDTNKDHLAAATRQYGVPKTRCYTNLDKALADVEADALIDVTPQQFRKGVCQAAFARGLHVLSEKPLADTLRNAQAIVKSAAKANRTYMVAQNYRFQPATQTARRLAQHGTIGPIGYIGVSFHKGPRFGGFREEMAYPLVLDMSIHHIDMIRCITGCDIVSVQATSVNAPWNWNKGDATVMAQFVLDNGCAVNYFGSWVAQGAETSWNADWRFAGASGTLEWTNDVLRVSHADGAAKRVPLVKMPVQHQAYLLEAFAQSLDTGEEPKTSGARNLNSLAATHAVVRAIKEDRRVCVRDMLA